jgi:hypothetical protein
MFYSDTFVRNTSQNYKEKYCVCPPLALITTAHLLYIERTMHTEILQRGEPSSAVNVGIGLNSLTEA